MSLAMLARGTDYTVALLTTGSSSQAGLITGQNTLLVPSSSSNAMILNSANTAIISSQLAPALQVNSSQITNVQLGQTNNGSLVLDLTLTGLGSDPTLLLQNLGNITLPLGNTGTGSTAVVTNTTNGTTTTIYNVPIGTFNITGIVVTAKGSGDDITIILAVIFSILGAVLLVFMVIWIRLNHRYKIVGGSITNVVGVVRDDAGNVVDVIGLQVTETFYQK